MQDKILIDYFKNINAMWSGIYSNIIKITEA